VKCASARDLIESYLDDELDPSVQTGIRDHLISCLSCAEIHVRLRELRMDIRTQAPYYDPPAYLQRRVQNSLAQVAKTEAKPGSADRRSVFRQWVAIAASILLVFSLALNFILFRSHRDERDTLAENIVSSHVRSLIGTHLLDVPSSDQHTVRPWFNGKLEFSPDVQDFASQGFPLMGGRIEYIANRSVAALVYRRGRRLINVFAWPTASSADSDGELTQKGYNMIHWSKAGMTYWVVSDLGLSELRLFADAYKEMLR
jgi:anti-sigma factor RsiW